MNQRVDFLIVGLGLAGSALAWELVQRGKSVLAYDTPARNRASAVAAGLFNPITGRVMTKSWHADDVFPLLAKFYSDAESILHRKFCHPIPIYRPFVSDVERALWRKRSQTPTMEKWVLKFHDDPHFDAQVHNPFGGLEIAHSGYLDVRSWMAAVRRHLESAGMYRDEVFVEQELGADELVRYGNCVASKIIFCGGVGANQTRWFGWLPLQPLKGETMEVRVPAPMERIYNRGVYLVPSSGEGIYTVGATYEHPPFREGTSQSGQAELDSRLRGLIKTPFEVVHQDWGMRPTTPDRRPVLGSHPANKNVVIFNGLGTKGVSLAPYFAKHLADWLMGAGDLSPEVNISRFKALSSG